MILVIETSSPIGSVALGGWTGDSSLNLGGGEDGKLLWQSDFHTGRARGGALFVALQAAIGVTGGHPVDVILVGLGPGSYSGVRLAISAAAGLALATGARLIGRPSVEALAADAPAYHAVSDARRGAFYYTAVKDRRCTHGPVLLEADDVWRRVRMAPEWPVLSDAPLPENLPASIVCLPRAEHFLARAASAEELSAAGGTLEPIYLRQPQITLAGGKVFSS